MFQKYTEETFLSSCKTLRVVVCFAHIPTNNPFHVLAHEKKVRHCKFYYEGRWRMMPIGKTIETLMSGVEDDTLIADLVTLERRYGTVVEST